MRVFGVGDFFLSALSPVFWRIQIGLQRLAGGLEFTGLYGFHRLDSVDMIPGQKIQLLGHDPDYILFLLLFTKLLYLASPF
jgi:hypothetical protein